ncbi:MAG: tetratricopeptide repeat protein [Myxococcota bacterium]
MLGLIAGPLVPTAHGQDARALFQQGAEALRQGRYADAEQAFQSSYRLRPHAATTCNLALTYERWGRGADAVNAYDRCAAEDTTGEYRQHAQERSITLRRQLAAAPTQPTQPMQHLAPAGPVMTAQPAATTTWTQAPVVTEVPSRPIGFLIGGLVALVAAGGSLTAGILFAKSARDADDELFERYGGSLQIPEFVGGNPNPDVQLLEDAKQDRTLAIAFYVGAGGLAALSGLLFILQVAQPAPPPIVMTATPLDGGAAFGLRTTF